jgi:hypothetical protein
MTWDFPVPHRSSLEPLAILRTGTSVRAAYSEPVQNNKHWR